MTDDKSERESTSKELSSADRRRLLLARLSNVRLLQLSKFLKGEKHDLPDSVTSKLENMDKETFLDFMDALKQELGRRIDKPREVDGVKIKPGRRYRIDSGE